MVHPHCLLPLRHGRRKPESECWIACIHRITDFAMQFKISYELQTMREKYIKNKFKNNAKFFLFLLKKKLRTVVTSSVSNNLHSEWRFITILTWILWWMKLDWRGAQANGTGDREWQPATEKWSQFAFYISQHEKRISAHSMKSIIIIITIITFLPTLSHNSTIFQKNESEKRIKIPNKFLFCGSQKKKMH